MSDREKRDPFVVLLEAHQIIWEDKSWPTKVRLVTCQILWSKALEVLHARYCCGNASTATSLEDLVEQVSANAAIAMP